MKPVLIVNAEDGWDNVSYVLDGEGVTPEQWEQLENSCENHGYILIDWKTLSGVESFLEDHQ